MKKFATLMAVVMVAVFSAGTLIAANAPVTVVIKDVQKSQAPVTFHHKAHAERIKNCQECHHKDAAGSEQSCFNCHKAEKKGPTGCMQCHKK